MTGTIKFYNADRGYGFIKDDDSDMEVFFHMRNLKGLSAQKGDRCTFDMIEDDKFKCGAFKAVNVEVYGKR